MASLCVKVQETSRGVFELPYTSRTLKLLCCVFKQAKGIEYLKSNVSWSYTHKVLMAVIFSAFCCKLEPVSCHELCQSLPKCQTVTSESWRCSFWTSALKRTGIYLSKVCSKSKALAAWFQGGIWMMSLQEKCFCSCRECFTFAC